MTFSTIKNDEREGFRRAVIASDLSKLGHVLTRKRVRFHFDTSMAVTDPPAFSLPDNMIHVNASKIGPMTDKQTIIDLLGLNYHELCHIMWTFNVYVTRNREYVQRAFGDFGKAVWNVLEDQRIERMFLNEYSATKPYFVSMIGRFIIHIADQQVENLYPLVVERSYLDPNIVEGFRKQFKKAHNGRVTKGVKRLAAEYVNLGEITARNDKRARDIIVEFCQLLSDEMPNEEVPPTPNHDEHDGDGTPIPAGMGSGKKPEPDDDDDEDDDEAEGQGSGGGEPDDEDDEESEDEGSGGSGDDESDEDDESEDDSDGDGDGDSDEDDDESDGDAAEGGHEAEGGSDKPSDTAKKAAEGGVRELKEALVEAVQVAESSEEVTETVVERQRSITSRHSLSKSSFMAKTGTNKLAVDPMETLVSKRLATQFSRVSEQEDPGYRPMENSGKINIKRAMNPEHDPDTVFDQWIEGQEDASDIEAVILIDTSGSMAGPSQQLATKATWILHRGIDTGAPTSQVTIIGFGSRTEMYSQRGEKADPVYMPNYPCNGATTRVADALEQARFIFGTSEKKKAVLLCVSDGGFHDAPSAIEQVEMLNGAGVITAHAFITSSPTIPSGIAAYPFQVKTAVSDIAHLVEFGKKVVETAIRTRR